MTEQTLASAYFWTFVLLFFGWGVVFPVCFTVHSWWTDRKRNRLAARKAGMARAINNWET